MPESSLETVPAGAQPGTPVPEGEGGLSESRLGAMPLLKHLEELRRRVIYAFWGALVGVGVGWWFSKPIFDYMQAPIIKILEKHHLDPTLTFLSPVDPFNMYLKIGLVAGLFIASPWILWQVWLFISPGLYRREKRWIFPFLLSTVGLFVAGGAFAYFRIFPVAMDFFISYGSAFKPMVTVQEYTKLFLMVVVGMGLVFEMPVLIFFLSFMGVVSPRFLWRNFRYAILIIFIVAGVLTPTNDISIQCLTAAPMIVLYVISIGVAWLAHPEHRARRAEEKAKAASQA